MEKYKKDLDSLIQKGGDLVNALSYKAHGDEFIKIVKKEFKEKTEAFLKDLPVFNDAYQTWYSEAKVLVKQLLPDRSEDFARLYEKPKSRKDISYENYTIEDALHGLVVTRGYAKEKVADADAAIPKLQQQVAIVQGAKARFESHCSTFGNCFRRIFSIRSWTPRITY